MKKIVFLILSVSFLLIADSIKTDLVVTFQGLTLEQAAELEKIINEDFSEYNPVISLPKETITEPAYRWWGYQDNNIILDTAITKIDWADFDSLGVTAIQ